MRRNTRSTRALDWRADPLLRQEKFSELLEKLAIAREIARDVFLLHLAEHGACSFKRIVARFSIGSARCSGCPTDEEAVCTENLNPDIMVMKSAENRV